MKKMMLALAVLLVGFNQSALAEAAPVFERITVYGEGRIEAVPDQMVFRFAVFEEGDQLRPMQKQVNQKVGALLKLAKKLGLAERDVQASRVNIYQTQRPKKSFSNNRQEYEQVFRISREVTFRLRDLEKYPQLLNGAIEAGANQLMGITPAFDNREALYRQALAKAMRAAEQKAGLLAQQAGVKLGQALNIQEGGGHSPQPRFKMMQAEMAVGMAADAAPFAAGTESITARVDVDFALEPAPTN